MQMPNLSTEEKFNLVRARLSSLYRSPSEEQLDFILHPINEACYLKACPGSGKTEVVGIKAAYEISEWQNYFSGIAVLSFTKNASKEIADRVKKFGGTFATQHPHFIGTIDSWLHGYILHPFAHKVTGYKGRDLDKSYRLIDNEAKYDFLSSFKTTISFETYPTDVWVNEYYFECSDPVLLQSQSRYLDLAVVDSSVKNVLQENKSRFLKAGLTTYADAEFLCYYLLKRNPLILSNLAKRFPIMIIDECQDLSSNQLEILKLLRTAGSVIHFVGDSNQSIYEFKKVYVEKINAFILDNKMVEKRLTRNFRSNQKIVNVCINLERYNTGIDPPKVIGNERELLSRSCILWEYSVNELQLLPQKFIDYINTQNLSIGSSDERISIRKSAILSRAHSTLSEFRSQPTHELSKVEMVATGLLCWVNNSRTGKDIQNALHLIGKFISLLAYNGIGKHQYQYCPDEYNPIEWRLFLGNLITRMASSSENVYPLTGLTWTQWTSRLKRFLDKYWSSLRKPINDLELVRSKIRAPKGSAGKLVIDTIKANQNNYSENVRMTTFHDVKGETLDAVLIVSSKDKKSKGGHIEQWLSGRHEEREYVRFAYVASSRPKHLLIWAIPKNANAQFKEKVKELGFTLQ